MRVCAGSTTSIVSNSDAKSVTYESSELCDSEIKDVDEDDPKAELVRKVTKMYLSLKGQIRLKRTKGEKFVFNKQLRRAEILYLYFVEHFSKVDVSRIAKASMSTTIQTIQYFESFATLYPDRVSNDKPIKVTMEDIKALENFINNSNKTLTIAAAQNFIRKELGKEIPRSTLYYHLKKTLKMSYKGFTRYPQVYATEESLRSMRVEAVLSILEAIESGKRLLCFDETTFNE